MASFYVPKASPLRWSNKACMKQIIMYTLCLYRHQQAAYQEKFNILGATQTRLSTTINMHCILSRLQLDPPDYHCSSLFAAGTSRINRKPTTCAGLPFYTGPLFYTGPNPYWYPPNLTTVACIWATISRVACAKAAFVCVTGIIAV